MPNVRPFRSQIASFGDLTGQASQLKDTLSTATAPWVMMTADETGKKEELETQVQFGKIIEEEPKKPVELVKEIVSSEDKKKNKKKKKTKTNNNNNNNKKKKEEGEEGHEYEEEEEEE